MKNNAMRNKILSKVASAIDNDKNLAVFSDDFGFTVIADCSKYPVLKTQISESLVDLDKQIGSIDDLKKNQAEMEKGQHKILEIKKPVHVSSSLVEAVMTSMEGGSTLQETVERYNDNTCGFIDIEEVADLFDYDQAITAIWQGNYVEDDEDGVDCEFIHSLDNFAINHPAKFFEIFFFNKLEADRDV
ncbi:hypothetical protein [Companilactobacillus mishanensis]|uniref:Uncharacterized protein n=1 Tax=Companilactobacillus mishanensis TaxID=2486008 RepID=A0A5P0ZEZ6_9LACO|nr:hypothetical protein [Companilactobacillus mishanensis]MQS44266.1 hypothetical protein [Companilactobacillus mishanensis]MQS51631.1 hypothetical protein [Companilactobacillus mishanensis]